MERLELRDCLGELGPRRRVGLGRELALAEVLVGLAEVEEVHDQGGVELERMQAGIVALPVTFRLPFVLKEVVGLSVADVARVLGLKPATVKTRLHRARLRVRQELEKSMEAREVPAAAYERQVCLDLLAAKQEALDRGTDLAQPVVCERCREVFASLDFAHDACRRLGDEAMPPDVKSRLLAAIAKAAT